MALTPADVKNAFQDSIPRRRDDFANAVRGRLRSIAHEDQYVQRFPAEVLSMAERELRARIDLAASRIKQLIDSGWSATEMFTVDKTFLDLFGTFDRWDKDPQSDLYHAVENAFGDVGSYNPTQATINKRRLGDVQVQAATEALSDLQVYYGEKRPSAPFVPLPEKDAFAAVERASNRWAYDVFICHASEDKGFVKELADGLRKRDVSVWLDESVLTIGDSLSGKIDAGLLSSRYGVVVLSHAFFKKEWPRFELDALVATQTSANRKVVLPVWYDVSQKDVMAQSPLLAGRVAAKAADGIERVVKELLAVIRSGAGASEPTQEYVAYSEPTTFREQVFQFVTDVRNLLRKYGPRPSQDATGDLIIEYSQDFASRYHAIKRHIAEILGWPRIKPLTTLGLPMTSASILTLTERLEQLALEIPAELPAYPLELSES